MKENAFTKIPVFAESAILETLANGSEDELRALEGSIRSAPFARREASVASLVNAIVRLGVLESNEKNCAEMRTALGILRRVTHNKKRFMNDAQRKLVQDSAMKLKSGDARNSLVNR
ncbi:MAG: hypothetical protein ABIH99_03145 [Candidatus Micrarchaeota archaeon]